MEPRDLRQKLTIYSVFHSKVFPEMYEDMNEEDKKCITQYGVKNTINTNMNIIYERDLDVYNPLLQQNWYNESTALFHIYMNGLYKKTKFIGLCQYDMMFKKNTIPDIFDSLDDKNIVYQQNNT